MTILQTIHAHLALAGFPVDYDIKTQPNSPETIYISIKTSSRHRNRQLYIYIKNTTIILRNYNKTIARFDLNDPNSISELTEALKNIVIKKCLEELK